MVCAMAGMEVLISSQASVDDAAAPQGIVAAIIKHINILRRIDFIIGAKLQIYLHLNNSEAVF